LEWLRVREDGIYVDATVGSGGHAALIAERARRGKVLGLDRDPLAVELARQRLAAYPHVTVLHANYGELRAVLDTLGIAQVSGVLIDAGVSSMQLDDPERGFSFQAEGPLDMRMNTLAMPSAKEFLSGISEEDLAEVLTKYGDVTRARRVAKAIVELRNAGMMNTTGDLVRAVQTAFGTRRVPEEVRTVFQAIRIAVNDEYRWLESGLRQAIEALEPAGRLVVIAFHSGEDRIVKNVIKELATPRRVFHPDGRMKECLSPVLKNLTPKPIKPSAEECVSNPRAHSARMRVAERVELSREAELYP